MSDLLDAVRSAWGADAPNWIGRLAQECANSSQRRVAERLNRSVALVNQVLHNKYSGDLNAVADVVRGVFMNSTIDCPALGQMPTNECRDWREKAKRFSAANMLRVRMYKACAHCPLNKRGHGHG